MRAIFIASLVLAGLLAPQSQLRAQRLSDAAGIPRAQRSALPPSRVSLVPVSSARRTWTGATIGVVVGAAAGALWARHIDRQQLCPAGSCEGRSNVPSYAVRGAVVGAVVGASIGWLSRER